MIINRNNINLISDMDLNNGTILMDKPLNLSSFKLVASVKNICKIKKIGHAGTLDPRATGLLILCSGSETKNIDKYVGKTKEYKGVFELGAKTKSYDSETEIYERHDLTGLDNNQIVEATKKYIGEILQVPPMYSAIKINGVRLYKHARKGKTVERKTRNIFIEKFIITKIEMPFVEFELVCSKGTYVRSLVFDVGEDLKVGAYLVNLQRTKIGEYSVEEALNLDELKSIFKKNVN